MLSSRWFSRASLVCTCHVVLLVHSAWHPVGQDQTLGDQKTLVILIRYYSCSPSLPLSPPSHTVDLSHTHCSLWPFGLSFSYQHCGQAKIKRAQPQDRRWVLSTLLNIHGCITRTLLSSKELVFALCVCCCVLHTRKSHTWNISHHTNFTVYKWPYIKMSSASHRFCASSELVSRTNLVQLFLLTLAHERCARVYECADWADRQGRLVSKVMTLIWPGWRKLSLCLWQSRVKESLRGWLVSL